MNGILNVLKPAGLTSYGVIRVVKRVSGEKKIGHIGTLDPMATGVLPLFLGKMTKLIPHFNLGDKAYRVTAKLGGRSTTLDMEGDLEEVPIPKDVTPEKVLTTLMGFVGEIEQKPPMYSAIKIGGKKLYEYARKGEEVERKTRRVQIYSITDAHYNPPFLHFEVHCSKGTYVRSLAADVAEKLGTSAYLTALRRTRCGHSFLEANAIPLDQIEQINKSALLTWCIDPRQLLADWHQAEISSASHIQQLLQGNTVELSAEWIRKSTQTSDSSECAVFGQDKQLLATGHLEFSQGNGGLFHPNKVFDKPAG